MLHLTEQLDKQLPACLQRRTLTQMTEDWLKDIDQQNIIGAVLLDFSAAFDIIDHSLLLKKCKSNGFTPSAVAWIDSYHPIGQRRFSLLEASQMQDVWDSIGLFTRTTALLDFYK